MSNMLLAKPSLVSKDYTFHNIQHVCMNQKHEMWNATPYAGNHSGWQALVPEKTHKWNKMIRNNVKAIAAGRPVLVVFYEDLKADPAPQLSRILQFLEVPALPDTINSTLKVHMCTHIELDDIIVAHTSVCIPSI